MCAVMRDATARSIPLSAACAGAFCEVPSTCSGKPLDCARDRPAATGLNTGSLVTLSSADEEHGELRVDQVDVRHAEDQIAVEHGPFVQHPVDDIEQRRLRLDLVGRRDAREQPVGRRRSFPSRHLSADEVIRRPGPAQLEAMSVFRKRRRGSCDELLPRGAPPGLHEKRRTGHIRASRHPAVGMLPSVF